MCKASAWFGVLSFVFSSFALSQSYYDLYRYQSDPKVCARLLSNPTITLQEWKKYLLTDDPEALRGRVQAVIQAAEAAFEERSVRMKAELTKTVGTPVSKDVLIVGAGAQGANFTALFSQAIRRAHEKDGLRKYPEILTVTDQDISPTFKNDDFVLNSPILYNKHIHHFTKKKVLSPAGLIDPNPFPGSPLDLFQLATHLGWSSNVEVQSLASPSKNYFFVENSPLIPKGNALFFPTSQQVYQANLIALWTSQTPVLKNTPITELGFVDRSLIVSTKDGIQFNPKFLVLAGGIGKPKNPFKDQKSNALFEQLTNNPGSGFPKAGSVNSLRRYIYSNRANPHAFEEIKGKHFLIIGAGDNGNIGAEALAHLDPRDGRVGSQLPKYIAKSLYIDWSGQKAKTADEFIKLQNFDRSAASSGLFRDVRYEKISKLFESDRFRPFPHTSESLRLTDDGRSVVGFSDGTYQVYDGVFSSVGTVDDLTPQVDQLLASAKELKIKFSEKIVDKNLLNHASSSEYVKTQLARQITFGEEYAPIATIIILGPQATGLFDPAKEAANLGSYQGPYSFPRIYNRNTSAFVNYSYRTEAMAIELAKEFMTYDYGWYHYR